VSCYGVGVASPSLQLLSMHVAAAAPPMLAPVVDSPHVGVVTAPCLPDALLLPFPRVTRLLDY
jgi:hypothetical protein